MSGSIAVFAGDRALDAAWTWTRAQRWRPLQDDVVARMWTLQGDLGTERAGCENENTMVGRAGQLS